ncbi:MAG: glycoside hydrolase family 88 protein, partial [Anaerolineae bacterium]
WSEATLPTSERLWSVSALAPDDAWVITYDGSILRRQPEYLTHLPLILGAHSFDRPTHDLSGDLAPALSPDDQRIAFVRRQEGEHSDVFLMNADGSGLRNLTQTPDADEDTPVCSPDGATIAFASDREGQWDIYFMNPSETDPTARPIITGTESDELHPFFSSGGDIMAFSSNRESGNWDLYTAPITDGTWSRLTADSSVERFPVFGADGRTLAYRREVNGDSEIYMMDVISQTTRRLTYNPGFDGYPALTPDLSGIVFVSNRSGDFQLYSMNVAGTGVLTLTGRHDYRAHTPRLSTDGRTLIYAAAPVGGTYSIYTMTYQSPLEVLARRGATDTLGRCDWTSGVFALGWGTAWRSTGDAAYARRIQDWVDSCAIDNYTITHVNDGLLGYGALMAYQFDPQPDYLAFAERVADYLMDAAPRTPKGTLAHFEGQVWADTLISAVPFLVEMNRVTGDPVYLDEAATQVMLHAEVLQDPTTNLFSHAWDEAADEYLSASYWGRGNSWNMIASAQLLNALPVSHGLRSQVVSIVQDQAEALAALQDPSGLWHTVVDRPAFYLESSGSAGIAYGLRCGLRAEWLPPELEAVAEQARLGLWRKVLADGTLTDASGPTGPMRDEEAYDSIPHETMQLYGQGMGLLALSP